MIVAALRKFDGNRSGTARYLSISRKVLTTLMAKFQICDGDVEEVTGDRDPGA